MKKGLCEIVCVVDRSGSMGSIREDAIGSFNTFLEAQQKQPGEATMTYTQFDDVYEVVHSGKAIKDVPKLTGETFVPRGGTALLDAVGRTIDEVGERLSRMPEDQRPEKVIFAVLTDGGENQSQKYTRIQVNQKISHQRDTYKWEFVFLAAGPDAFAEAMAMGFQATMVTSYQAGNAVQHNAAVQKLSSYTSSSRTGATPNSIS